MRRTKFKKISFNNINLASSNRIISLRKNHLTRGSQIFFSGGWGFGDDPRIGDETNFEGLFLFAMNGSVGMSRLVIVTLVLVTGTLSVAGTLRD